MTMDKLKMHSPDLFPGCVTEARDGTTGKLPLVVDFNQLRQELNDRRSGAQITIVPVSNAHSRNLGPRLSADENHAY